MVPGQLGDDLHQGAALGIVADGVGPAGERAGGGADGEGAARDPEARQPGRPQDPGKGG